MASRGRSDDRKATNCRSCGFSTDFLKKVYPSRDFPDIVAPVSSTSSWWISRPATRWPFFLRAGSVRRRLPQGRWEDKEDEGARQPWPASRVTPKGTGALVRARRNGGVVTNARKRRRVAPRSVRGSRSGSRRALVGNAILDALLDALTNLCGRGRRVSRRNAREFAAADVVTVAIGIDGAVEAFIRARCHGTGQFKRTPWRRVADVVPGKMK